MATMEDELNDEELYDLFSAFDDVKASDELKTAALEHVLQGAGGPAGQSEFTATAGGARKKSGVRSKWRAMRVAAIAACLALALTGGAAYALPASYVTVAQGGASIELGVNRFGITVSATSDDEVGLEIVESAGLKNISYEDALARAYDLLAQRDPDEPIALVVRSDDEGLKAGLEKENDEFMAQHVAAGAGVVEFQESQQTEPNASDAQGDGGLPSSGESVDVRNNGENGPAAIGGGGDDGDPSAGGAPPDEGRPDQQPEPQSGGGQQPDR